MENVTASPLSWPPGKPRTLAHNRKRAAFGKVGGHGWKEELSIAEAVQRLERELVLVGGDGCRYILSSDLKLNRDGSPRSSQADPRDPGVAVYFELDKRPIALACDKWDRCADNIVAIAKHIEALRGQDRWGVGSLEQAFAGYAALPAPGKHATRPWRKVLGYEVEANWLAMGDVEIAFRDLARIHHPDVGGDPAAFAELTRARDEARAELRA